MPSPLDSLAALAAGLPLRAANRLLGNAPWARARLAPFAGEYVALSCAPFPPLAFEILADGSLAQAAAGQNAGVTVKLTPIAMASFAADPGSEGSFADDVEIAGNPALAVQLRHLLRHLRWDIEDSLARWIGDAPAQRAAAAARCVGAWQRDALRSAVENLLEYLVHERRELVQGTELCELASATRPLEEALADLEARAAQLERGP